MLRFFLLAFFLYVLVKFIRILLRKPGHEKRTKIERTGEMVACKACSTFVLKSSAVKRNNDFYCCDVCKDNGGKS